jgi:hypothetical protein
MSEANGSKKQQEDTERKKREDNERHAQEVSNAATVAILAATIVATT